EETTEEPSDLTPEGLALAKKISFEVSKAFGETGKKTITLNIQPAGADIGVITWNKDNPHVKLTPSADGLSAEVYVTNYFADYATITVHESYSDITATGKVYSYGAYDIPTMWGSNYTTNIFDAAGKTGVYITSTNSLLPSTTQSKHLFDREKLNSFTSFRDYYGTEELMNQERAKMGYDWVEPLQKVWLHITYVGSYEPVIFNQTTGVIYNGSSFSTKNPAMEGSSDIGNILSVELTLTSGDNMILIAGRNHSLTPTAITSADFGATGNLVGSKLVGAKTFNYSDSAIPLVLTNAVAPQSITLPDVTFTE
ncbi:MAG: hypothetical protein WC994_11310, partial [Brumimicrobium sp.]